MAIYRGVISHSVHADLNFCESFKLSVIIGGHDKWYDIGAVDIYNEMKIILVASFKDFHERPTPSASATISAVYLLIRTHDGTDVGGRNSVIRAMFSARNAEMIFSVPL